MIKIKDISIPSKIRVSDLHKKMTPKSLLMQKEFERPYVITPEEFPSFEYLFEHRNEIKNLKLVPVKDDTQHNLYNSLDKKELENEVNSYLEDSDVTCTDNLYPYWLSSDIKQSLIWVKEGVTELQVLFFISKWMSLSEVSMSEIILFERPINTKSILVKGTFPAVRHIHVWTKIKTK